VKNLVTRLAPMGAIAVALLLSANSPVLAATKVGLDNQAFGSCTAGPTGGDPIDGFAVIGSTNGPHPTVSGVLQVRGLTPNHTYNLALVQTPGGEDCFAAEYQLTTNDKGNGSLTVREALRPGTTGAFFLVPPSDDNGFIHSIPLVTFGPSATVPVRPNAHRKHGTYGLH
jgi:hypothetical protein